MGGSYAEQMVAKSSSSREAGAYLLKRLDDLMGRVKLEGLRDETVERRQARYRKGDRVVLTIAGELTRPKGSSLPC